MLSFQLAGPTLVFPDVESVAIWRPLLLIHLVEPRGRTRRILLTRRVDVALTTGQWGEQGFPHPSD